MMTHSKNKTFSGTEKQHMPVLYSVKVLLSL